MSFRLWKFSSCLFLAAISCLPVDPMQAAEGWRGRKIEFSDSQSPVVTNLNQLNGKNDGLERLQRELNKSKSVFSPNSSLEGLQAPAYRPVPGPVIQSRRVKELLEQRKNWMFANPDELTSSPSMEEMLQTPEFGADGLEKKKGPSLERFYENLNRPRTKEGAGSASLEDPFGARQKLKSGESGSGDDANLPGGLRDSEQALRKMLDSDTRSGPFGAGMGRSSFSDFFGLGETRSPLDQEQAHRDYLKQYQQWLNGTPSAPVASSLNPLGTMDSARPATPLPQNGLETLSGSSRRSFDSTLGVINPTFNVGTVPDVNTKVLNQWNPLYVPPKNDPPKVTRPAPSSPIDAIPRRKFM